MENRIHKITEGTSPSRVEYMIHITLLISQTGQQAILFLAFRIIPARETAAAIYPRRNKLSILFIFVLNKKVLIYRQTCDQGKHSNIAPKNYSITKFFTLHHLNNYLKLLLLNFSTGLWELSKTFPYL